MKSQGLKGRLKSILRITLFPVVRYFGPRFHMLHTKLDETNDAVDAVHRRLNDFESHIAVDLQTTIEYANTLQRTAHAVDKRFAELTLLAQSTNLRPLAGHRTLADLAAGQLVGLPLEELGLGAAKFLNWASSGGEEGFQVQAGVWFNPTVALHHEPGNVRALFVNERIVEIPYALTAAGNLEQPSSVIDVGSNESLLALSLASAGHKVLAVDPRGYPLAHPDLGVVSEPIEDWPGPEVPVDAIFCVSTLEHLGLGAYEQDASDLELDKFVIERFRSWLKPGGRLILTAPFGNWSMDEFQRVYDREHFDNLMKGWSVLDRRLYWHESAYVWRMLPNEAFQKPWESEDPGVILVTASPEA